MIMENRFATHFDPEIISNLRFALSSAWETANSRHGHEDADETKALMTRIILARAARGETNVDALARHALAAVL